MREFETVKVEQVGAAGVLTLNRPEKRNAINFKMMDEIEAALADLGVSDAVYGVIVTGAGACFSSGVDLNGMRDMSAARDFTEYMSRWRRLNKLFETNPKPIVAAIEGYCLTGGLELATACDLRVGAEGSSYTITSSKIGTVPGAGGTQRLPRLIGVSNALDILFSAEPVDANRARQMGLLNRLTNRGGALEEALNMVETYAQRAPLSLQFCKRAVYAGMNMSLDDALEFEGFVVNTIYTTTDKQEGVRAFLEKRAPRFTGR
ncbi:short chain enoyl-CoA hydratase [Caballeronia calidae]|uniref:Short chain enoyl-CoA hydratase n=1 Tax=Caballeronia calidae TaxID=1777139 RepID=A0A158E4D2_9BURK|nr:enoyl-CoA hydratase/isomerase family protein [Caballeronia calidae]SAL01709.1 short chain enoyl-CoA hydratase [Caballeronia calidae]